MLTSRRQFLQAASCCVAGSSGLGTLSMAAGPGENRLVVILLRGAMDGLQLLRPLSDPNYKSLRPTLSRTAKNETLIDVDGLYGLCLPEEAKALGDLWQADELSFIQAVSTPYRGGRSHFDGQDILESGGTGVGAERTGWLTRMIDVMPTIETGSAITLSPTAMLLGRGESSVSNWSTESMLAGEDISPERLLALYDSDPDFHAAASDAFRLSAIDSNIALGGLAEEQLAKVSANFLRDKFRIAAFSVGGWDTHSGQAKSFQRRTRLLARIFQTMKTDLGPIWENTTVVCVTEFGRSARENGSAGTDHGTGGMAILTGGAVRGGKVFGKWPGLGSSDLFENRDLRPTSDIRLYLSSLFIDLFGAKGSDIQRDVFPGLEWESKPSLIL